MASQLALFEGTQRRTVCEVVHVASDKIARPEFPILVFWDRLFENPEITFPNPNSSHWPPAICPFIEDRDVNCMDRLTVHIRSLSNSSADVLDVMVVRRG